MKHLLILEGSPRRAGNSTALSRAFSAALKGWTVETVRVCDKTVNGCLACDHCWSREGKPCVQRDDMNELCEQIERADAVVLATPMYYFSFPSRLKAVIDRLYPYCKDNRPRSIDGKSCMLLVCGATDVRDEFTPMVDTYRVLAHYLGWKDMGVLAADSLYERGAVEGTTWLEQAAALADKLNGGALL